MRLLIPTLLAAATSACLATGAHAQKPRIITTEQPLYTMPRLAQPPVIDGVLNADEWSKAARVTGFSGLDSDQLVEDQTLVYSGYDDEALYFGFECLDPKKRPIVTRATGRDGAPYLDDGIDLLIQPEEGKPYYHLVSNAAGAIYDSRSILADGKNFDTTFNPNWTIKTGQEPGRWVLECKIPFKELDGRSAPKEGERWRINFCRDADSGSRLSSWSWSGGNFHVAENFGKVVFSNTDRGFRLSPLGDEARGKIDGNIAMTGLKIDPLVTVQVKLTGSDGKPIAETESRLADFRSVNIKAPSLVTGDYRLSVRASTEAGEVFSQNLPFHVIKPYDVSVAGYPYEGKLWVTTNVAGLGDNIQGVIARSQLLQGDKVISTTETSEFVRGLGDASIDIQQLPPGKYLVKSAAVAPDGKTLATAEAEFEQFAKPNWWKSPAGIEHTVPIPWKPITFRRGTLNILNRQYRTGNGSLPQQVVTNGTAILAGPVTLKLKTGNATADLGRLNAKVGESFPDAITRVAQGKVGNINVELKSQNEFDGMQICNLTLTPNGSSQVDNLTLEIPVKSEFAKFILPSTGVSSAVAEIGKEAWHSGFIPQVWIGDDDRGYGWFAESDQFWAPHDGQMLEVVREGDRTFIRCKMIRQVQKLNKPIHFKFGLMATPTKDVPFGDAFLYRFGSTFGDKHPVEYLRYPGADNIDPKSGTLEFWLAPGQNDGILRQVGSIRGPGGGLFLAMTRKDQASLALTVKRGDKSEEVVAKGLIMQPGEFHHVAVTWGDKVELFVDGKSYGTTTAGIPTEPFADPGKTKFNMGTGDGYYDHTDITVDEVRISKGIRYNTAFTPPTAPFATDAQTMLLDHLDVTFKPDGEDAETRADKISGKSNELGGVPSIGSRFVTGKFGSALQMPPISSLTPVQYVSQQGANASWIWVWHEDSGLEASWPPPMMEEPKRPKLREIIKEHNDAGLRLTPYTAYPAVGAPSDLHSQFGQEWSLRPISTMPYEPPKGHYLLSTCSRSGFADYMSAGTKWTLNDLGFYATYTDGLTNAMPCQNVHHGCGYYDEEGILHSTYPVFPNREMVKRMYKIIKAAHPDGYLVNHLSFNSNIASLTFSDMNYSGEHEVYEDLLKWRVRWQGKNLGFWPILLGGSSHGWEAMHNTYALLHGTHILPNGLFGRNDMFRKTANLWQTYDKFGYRQAKFIPYYLAEKDLAKAQNEKVKVSLYSHPGKKAMFIIGNLAPEVVNTTVKLDLKKLGLKGTSAKNLLDERVMPVTNGTLDVRLRPSSFLLVEVE